MKKLLLLVLVSLMYISCVNKSSLDNIEDTLDNISYIPGTKLIVAGESLNPEYVLQVESDGDISIVKSRDKIKIENAKEKYEEILLKIKKELNENKKITRCKKVDSMWIGEVGLRLTVEGAISGKRGKILACYHNGNKTLIKPNYQIRTDAPLIQIRINEEYYELASPEALYIYDNRMLQ